MTILTIASLALICAAPVAVDGDTLRCRGGERVRIEAIDAPEMPGHCRAGRRCTVGDPHASKDHLAWLIRGQRVECETSHRDGYGRLIGRCTAGGVDLGCAQVSRGFAVERYGRLTCR